MRNRAKDLLHAVDKSGHGDAIGEAPYRCSQAERRAEGKALRDAVPRAGDAAMIAGYMGSGSILDEAICDFAVDYADQTERDHKAFVKAIREGRVKAVIEPVS